MKKQISQQLLLIILVMIFSSCKQSKKEVVTDALALHIYSTVKAGYDLFHYANGKWFHQNPIPASEQSNGVWQLIQDTINAQILKVCKSAMVNKDDIKGSNKQKIGDFFYTGMDS